MGHPLARHTAAVIGAACVVWSMEETRAVSGANDGSVPLWDIESQKPVGLRCTAAKNTSCVSRGAAMGSMSHVAQWSGEIGMPV